MQAVAFTGKSKDKNVLMPNFTAIANISRYYYCSKKKSCSWGSLLTYPSFSSDWASAERELTRMSVCKLLILTCQWCYYTGLIYLTNIPSCNKIHKLKCSQSSLWHRMRWMLFQTTKFRISFHRTIKLNAINN